MKRPRNRCLTGVISQLSRLRSVFLGWGEQALALWYVYCPCSNYFGVWETVQTCQHLNTSMSDRTLSVTLDLTTFMADQHVSAV